MPACRRHLGDPDRAFAEAAREIALERAREIFPNLTSVAKWETPGGQPPVDDLTTQLHILVITNRIKQGEAIKRGDLVGYLLSAGYLPVREPIDPHRGFDDVDEVDDSAYPECHPPLAFLP